MKGGEIGILRNLILSAKRIKKKEKKKNFVFLNKREKKNVDVTFQKKKSFAWEKALYWS